MVKTIIGVFERVKTIEMAVNRMENMKEISRVRMEVAPLSNALRNEIGGIFNKKRHVSYCGYDFVLEFCTWLLLDLTRMRLLRLYVYAKFKLVLELVVARHNKLFEDDWR